VLSLERDEQLADRAAYERVRALYGRAVPVVGAGVAGSAGAPTTGQLVEVLADAVGVPAEGAGLFELADRLEHDQGREAVNRLVAEQFPSSLGVTPALLALARTPGRLVVTTNYDDAIEQAARAAGLVARSFVPASLDEFLAGPPAGTVHVLHLHGTVEDPGSIVLTSASYAEINADERVQFGLRTLAVTHTLVFLGHSLGASEEHVRRDILWATQAFPRTRTHLLVHRHGSLSPERLAELEKVGVSGVGFTDPDGSYGFVGRVAGILGGPSALASQAELPLVSEPVERWYVPVPLVAHDQVRTEMDRRFFYATGGRYRRGPGADALAGASRLLVVGGPGYGKSQLARHLARAEASNAVLVRLGGAARPAQLGQGPTAAFVSWLGQAQAFGRNVARPTLDSIVERAYTFVLDGLDEVPAGERRGVLEVITAVAERHPEHRFVLTSRPLELLEVAQEAGFARYGLMPTQAWLRRYATHRGLEQDGLDRLAAGVQAVAEMCRIPIFAAAAVDLLLSGDPLPGNVLELVLAYADKGLDAESDRLPVPKATVQAWLGRLALAMELANAVVIDRAVAASGRLETGLGVPSTDRLMDEMVERALLSEDGDRVGFHAPVIQEARAAAAWLEAPGGLAFLALHALLDAAGERGVRPALTHTVELLLTSAPAEWREIIAVYDPLVVARTTAPDADVATRSAAIADIWAWYQTRRVWLPRDRAGQLVDDLRAIELLAKAGVTDNLREEVRAGCGSKEPVTRGNAIAALVAIGDTDTATEALPALLRDDHPVVRRRAAAAAWDLEAVDVIPVLRDQLAVEADEMARQTLSQVLVRLVPDDQVIDLLESFPPPLRLDVRWVLDDRWNAAEQLHRLSEAPAFDEDWCQEILDHADATQWGSDELRLLVRLIVTRHYYTLASHEQVRALAASHPRDVWAEGLKHVATVEDLFDLAALAPDPELISAAAAAINPAARPAVEQYLELRRSSQGSQATRSQPRPQPTPRPSLGELVESGDLQQLLRRSPTPSDLASLTNPQRAALAALVANALHEWAAAPEPPDETAWRAAPHRFTPPTGMRWAEWSAALELPLDRTAWLRLAGAPIYLSDVDRWVRHRFDLAWQDDLAAGVATWAGPALDHGVSVVPAPWSAKLAAALAGACFANGADDHTKQHCVRQLAANRQHRVLQQLRADGEDPLVDDGLVRAGDCAAEDRLLASLLDQDIPVLPELPSALQDHWIAFVRCPRSVPGLVEVLRRLLRAGVDSAALAPVFAALHQAAGGAALAHYDDLLADAAIKEGPFLWYRRQELVDELLEQHARRALPDTLRELGQLILAALSMPR
jgi:hypothetical protein